MTRFDNHLAATLAGPDWLRARRAAAADVFAATPWPSPAEEIWRYSRIDRLDLARFAPAGATAAASPDLGRWQSWQPAGLIVTVDGVVVHEFLDPALAARKVTFGPASPESLGSVLATPNDALGAANDAFHTAPLALSVPRGVAVEAPIVVVHLTVSDGIATFPRLVVHAGDNAEVSVLEVFESGDVLSLVAPVTELLASTAARVRYLAVNQLGNRVWQVSSLASVGERDSSTTIGSAMLGGDYARSRIDARLVGVGAHTDQVAVYFADGDQMHDVRTIQDHQAPKTTSNLLFKGAVAGHANSVYTGLIKVRPEAAGTRALQTNRNIKLSDGAWAESVPNLEIENNDVQCSHASSVGPIDADERFYVESRGVPPSIAERLIVLGFFDEVLDRLPVPAVGPMLRQAVADKLERSEA